MQENLIVICIIGDGGLQNVPFVVRCSAQSYCALRYLEALPRCVPLSEKANNSLDSSQQGRIAHIQSFEMLVSLLIHGDLGLNEARG